MFKSTVKLLLLFLALSALVLAIFGVVTPVEAQTTISVNIKTAKFKWEWAQGTGAAATKFTFSCNSGALLHDVNDITLREYPVAVVVVVPGTYTCAVLAANEFGFSPPSNTVDFKAGDVPGVVSKFTIEVQ